MAFKMKSPSVAKMAKMAGNSRSAAKFNAKLRKASKEGKLNPEFKAAVDAAPMKKKPGYNPGGKKLPAAKMEKVKPIEGFHHVPNKGFYDEYGQYGKKHKEAKTLRTK